MAKIFRPLLALIASGTDRELAKYVQFLKEENKMLRTRIKGDAEGRVFLHCDQILERQKVRGGIVPANEIEPGFHSGGQECEIPAQSV